MFNAFDPKGAPEPTGRDRADRVPEQQPLADREVPIGFAVTPAGVHEWLDGDAAETDIRRAPHFHQHDSFGSIRVATHHHGGATARGVLTGSLLEDREMPAIGRRRLRRAVKHAFGKEKIHVDEEAGETDPNQREEDEHDT